MTIGAMVLPAALLLTLAANVSLSVGETPGLDPAESTALASTLDGAVRVVTGQPAAGPGAGAPLAIAVVARRVGWRIHVSAELREPSRPPERAETDLTRDRRSWPVPIELMVRALLRDRGRAAKATVAQAPAAAPPGALPSKPPLDAVASSSKRRQPRPAGEPTQLGPLANTAAPAPAQANMQISEVAPAADGPRIAPWIVMAISAGVFVVGVTQAIGVKDAINSLPTDRIPTVQELEDQQDAVFRGALLGSVLMSVGASGIISSLLVLTD